MQEERWPASDAPWVRRADLRVSHSTSPDGVFSHPLFIPVSYYSLDPSALLSKEYLKMQLGIGAPGAQQLCYYGATEV